MALICTSSTASADLFRSLSDTDGTSLFLPSSMMPASYQPVTTSTGSSTSTGFTRVQPASVTVSRDRAMTECAWA